jgi:hypothetical protein
VRQGFVVLFCCVLDFIMTTELGAFAPPRNDQNIATLRFLSIICKPHTDPGPILA